MHQWSHSLQGITYRDPHTATALFSNSVSATGTIIIGADGSHSAVRSHLLSHNPSLAKNSCLPVRFLGVSTIFPPTLALEARALDPFFFQGGDPQKDTFLYFSFLDTPSKNERLNDEGTWECQIIISYPYRSGFWGKEEPMEVPETHKERVALMKEFADGWANPFRSLILAIPDETEVKALPIEDFVPKEGMWDTSQGKVTMVGDAAHAMTMCELSVHMMKNSAHQVFRTILCRYFHGRHLCSASLQRGISSLEESGSCCWLRSTNPQTHFRSRGSS